MLLRVANRRHHSVADRDVLERNLTDFKVHIGQHRPHCPILADDIRRVDRDLLTVTLARVGFDHFECLIAVQREPQLRGGGVPGNAGVF